MSSGGKQAQVLDDLASFFVSNSHLEFTPPGSPVKVTPPTSDSEKDPPQQPVAEVQRNVFITNQDVTSRRRKPNNRGKPSGLSSSLTSGSAAADDTRRRRIRPSVHKSGDPLSVSSSHTSSGPRRSKSLTGESLGTRSCHGPDYGKQEQQQPMDVQIPLKDNSGGGGSALEKLKRRSTSGERSRAAPGRSKSDELAEMDRSRRSNSRDAGRRAARRRKTEGEGIMADNAAQVNDPEMEDLYAEEIGMEKEVDVKDDSREQQSSSHRRRPPDRSKSDDLAEVDRHLRSNSKDAGRRPPGRSKSDDLAEVDRHLRSSSKDAGRRRARRRNTHGDDVMAESAEQVKDFEEEIDEDLRKMVDNAIKQADREVPLKDDQWDDKPSDLDRSWGSSGSRNRRRHRNGVENASATSGSDGSGHRRPSARSVGGSDFDQSDRSGGSGGGPRRKPRSAATATSDDVEEKQDGDLVEPSTRKDSSSKDVVGATANLNKESQVLVLDKAQEASSSTSEDRPTKWSGVKHGMAFINKAKAEVEQKSSGQPSRRDQRRTSRSGQSSSSSGARDGRSSRSSGNKESGSNRRSVKVESDEATNQHSHPATQVDVGMTQADTDIEGTKVTDGPSPTGAAPVERSRPRGSTNSKWAEIKERSLSRSQSTEPTRIALDKDGAVESNAVKTLTRHNSDDDALAKNLARLNENSVLKPSSQPNLTRSNSDSSLSVLKQAAENLEVAEESTMEQLQTEQASSKPASTIFKNLLNKSMLRKSLVVASSCDEGANLAGSKRADAAIEKGEQPGGPPGPKPASLKKLIMGPLGVAKGEAENKASRWGGLKNGMDFTSRLIKVTAQKKEVDGPTGSAGNEVVGEDSSTAKPRKSGLWNLGLGATESKEDSTDDMALDYGQMNSLRSFPDEALEGLVDDDEKPTDDTSESPDAVSDAPTSGEPDLFSIFEAASSGGQPDAFAVLTSTAPAPVTSVPDRRTMMVGLAAPSMRFDFDKKTETVVNRNPGLAIIEDDEEDEEEDDDDDDDEDDAESKEDEKETPCAQDQKVPLNVLEEYDEEDESDDSDSAYESDGFLSPMKCMQLKFEPVPSAALGLAIHSLDQLSAGEEGFEDEEVKIHRMDNNGIVFDLDVEEEESRSSPIIPEKEEINTNEETNAAGEVQLSVDSKEYELLCRELEASKARMKTSRAAVRLLQEEIQKHRQLYNDAERRRQATQQEMLERKVCLVK